MYGHRRTVRLQAYDYAQSGAYFVTIVTQNRRPLFGDIVDGSLALTSAGVPVQSVWENLPKRFPFLSLDGFVLMPNHLHGIVVISPEDEGEHKVRPYAEGTNSRSDLPDDTLVRASDRPAGTSGGSLGRIIQAFKSATTHAYIRAVTAEGWPPFQSRLWQRNYHEHIIRSGADLDRVRRYVLENPAHWAEDQEYPGS